MTDFLKCSHPLPSNMIEINRVKNERPFCAGGRFPSNQLEYYALQMSHAPLHVFQLFQHIFATEQTYHHYLVPCTGSMQPLQAKSIYSIVIY